MLPERPRSNGSISGSNRLQDGSETGGRPRGGAVLETHRSTGRGCSSPPVAIPGDAIAPYTGVAGIARSRDSGSTEATTEVAPDRRELAYYVDDA